MPVASLKRDSPERSFASLRHLISGDLDEVDRIIVALLENPVAMIPAIAGRLVSSGGKRIRPTLTLLAARMFGYRGDRHVNLAACIEFIHTATLLHDAVVDDSALRRGAATANSVWGNKPSVLVGDFLLSRAFRLMSRTDRSRSCAFSPKPRPSSPRARSTSSPSPTTCRRPPTPTWT